MDTTTTDSWGATLIVGRGASAIGLTAEASSIATTPAAPAIPGESAWHRSHLSVTAKPNAYGVKQGFNRMHRRPSEGSS